MLHQSFEEALLAGRRRALAEARLYFVCEACPTAATRGRCSTRRSRGGVDVIQLREKAPRCAEELIAFAEPFARAAREHGALFFLNDEPDLVEACGADGVHVGQDDEPVAAARARGRRRGAGRPLDPLAGAVRRRARGRGRARPDQISAGPGLGDADQAGRPAAGLELIEHAARGAGDGRRGSRSAASTPRTSARSSPPARGGSSSCARSATPPTPRRLPASCARRSRPSRGRSLGAMASRERKRAERRKRKERGAERQAELAAKREAMAARTEAKNEAARGRARAAARRASGRWWSRSAR